MKEFYGVIIQIVFLLVGLGIAFSLLYFGFISNRKKKIEDLDVSDFEIKEKFIGRT